MSDRSKGASQRALLVGIGLVWVALLWVTMDAWEPARAGSHQLLLLLAGVGFGLAAALVVRTTRAIARLEREQKDVEATLGEREGFLSRLASSTPATIFAFDVLDGRTVYTNRRLADRLGYARGELGREEQGWPERFVHPDDREAYRAIEERYRTAVEGEVLHHEIRFRNASGGWSWLETWATVASRDPDGRARLVVGTSMDVTSRHLVAAELERSEQRFRLLAENARDIISRFALLPEPRMEFISPSVTAILGYTPEEFYQDPGLFTTMIHPDDQALLASAQAHFPSFDRPLTLRWRHKDGHTVWLELQGVSVFDDDGRLVAAETISRDVTETRQLEELLRQAQKMDAIGRLAGGVAHDFNNLLGVIAGYVALIRERAPGNPEILDGLSAIEEVTSRATALTRQLLGFVRRDSLRAQTFDLGELVSNLERMLRRLLPASIELRTERPSAAALISADPGQIEQAVLNLVVNARDAMPRGGRVTISVTAEEEGGVRLSVHDDGEGMDAATMARVFEPFFTTKERGRGTGLGLAIVRAVTRQVGGQASVSSALGEGSTFSLRFPAANEPEAAAEAVTPGRAAGGSETVLVVEDEPRLLSIVERSLTARGYTVLGVKSGAEALALAADETRVIDGLLTDLVTPDLDGREVARRLMAIRPRLAVVYMSGYIDGPLAGRALVEGARLLEKPFDEAALARVLREALEARAPEPGQPSVGSVAAAPAR